MATLAAPELQQSPQTNGLYQRDFYSWAAQQAAALQRRDHAAIDWDNIIEEITDLGADRRNSWTKFCGLVLEHLLKIEYWAHADKGDLRHWEKEIRVFRFEMAVLIEQNPGLKGHYAAMFAAAWKRGRYLAVERLEEYDEKRRPAGEGTYRNWGRLLPEECPYRLEHVAAYDPQTDREPRKDIQPPAVAIILNTQLGRDYPILRD